MFCLHATHYEHPENPSKTYGTFLALSNAVHRVVTGSKERAASVVDESSGDDRDDDMPLLQDFDSDSDSDSESEAPLENAGDVKKAYNSGSVGHGRKRKRSRGQDSDDDDDDDDDDEADDEEEEEEDEDEDEDEDEGEDEEEQEE